MKEFARMVSQDTQTDVVVIGGGMAGLSAVSYLAKAGIAVTLFEKAAGLGGRAATQQYDEYRFNRGIHALYTGGAASQVLQELGIRYSYAIPKAVFTLQKGRFHTFPSDVSTLLRTDLLSLGDKLELMRLFATLPGIRARDLAHVSVQEWLNRTTHRPQVRKLLTGIAYPYVYSASLDLVSAEVFVDKVQRSLKHPIHYIDGGWQELADALRRKAEQAGARIVSGTRVESIELHNGRAQGVRLADGSLLRASAVVVATEPQDAAKLVEHGNYAPLRKIVDALIPAQVACLDVALRRLPAAQHPVVFDLDQPRLVSAQSIYARMAPQDGALVCAFKQLDPAHRTDPREDERDLEDLLDAAQPGWREVLIKRVYLPRIQAVGALPTAKSGGFAGRPGIEVPGLQDLYLAGDWIGPEGFLVDASMASARQVARLLSGKLASERAVA
jgi:phytoene dehydrogenase-like protein